MLPYMAYMDPMGYGMVPFLHMKGCGRFFAPLDSNLRRMHQFVATNEGNHFLKCQP